MGYWIQYTDGTIETLTAVDLRLHIRRGLYNPDTLCTWIPFLVELNPFWQSKFSPLSSFPEFVDSLHAHFPNIIPNEAVLQARRDVSKRRSYPVTVALTTVMLLAFFLPWGQLLGEGVSGYTCGQIGSYANLVWLIPILASAVLIVALSAQDVPALRVACGGVPWLYLFYGVVRVGSDLFHVLAIGAYLTLLCGFLLLFAGPLQRWFSRPLAHIDGKV
jgi:hypothetical protein